MADPERAANGVGAGRGDCLARRVPKPRGVFKTPSLTPGQQLCANRGVQRWFDVTGIREPFSLMQSAIWHRLFIDGSAMVPPPDEDPLDWVADNS